jgi:hypothetical protein
MDDTKVGAGSKDDPALVAKQGVEAMLKDKEKVVAGSAKTKVQGMASKVLPDSTKAKMHRRDGRARLGRQRSGPMSRRLSLRGPGTRAQSRTHRRWSRLMAESHTPADNIVYDLVAIQYHALKAGQVYAQYAADAEDHADVQEFIEQCRQEDAERAVQAHDLLGKLTAKGAGIG